jgi:hypothetical protein
MLPRTSLCVLFSPFWRRRRVMSRVILSPWCLLGLAAHAVDLLLCVFVFIPCHVMLMLGLWHSFGRDGRERELLCRDPKP